MEPAFLSVFFVISFMKGDEGSIFSEAPDWKTLFTLNTFIKISGPILTNDWENIACWEESEQRVVLANKFVLSKTQLGILGLVTTPRKFCNFLTFLSTEVAFPALKLTENCYLNINIFFLKNGNFIINWVPSLFYKHTVPERLSSQSSKMKSLGLQKSQFLNSLVNWQ